MARNIVGEAATTLRLNVVSRRNVLSPNNEQHRIKGGTMYSSLSDDNAFLKIEPEVLTADVGAKAHFSCQGNILDEILSRDATESSKTQLGMDKIKYRLTELVCISLRSIDTLIRNETNDICKYFQTLSNI